MNSDLLAVRLVAAICLCLAAPAVFAQDVDDETALVPSQNQIEKLDLPKANSTELLPHVSSSEIEFPIDEGSMYSAPKWISKYSPSTALPDILDNLDLLAKDFSGKALALHQAAANPAFELGGPYRGLGNNYSEIHSRALSLLENFHLINNYIGRVSAARENQALPVTKVRPSLEERRSRMRRIWEKLVGIIIHRRPPQNFY